jgi:acetamidase/formamidase
MGANEPTSVAIECAGAATVRLGVRKGLRLETPRIETADRLYTIGLQPHDRFLDARQQALGLMWDFLVAEAGLEREEAYGVLSAAVEVELGGPAGMVVLASVARSLLPGEARSGMDEGPFTGAIALSPPPRSGIRT